MHSMQTHVVFSFSAPAMFLVVATSSAFPPPFLIVSISSSFLSGLLSCSVLALCFAALSFHWSFCWGLFSSLAHGAELFVSVWRMRQDPRQAEERLLALDIRDQGRASRTGKDEREEEERPGNHWSATRQQGTSKAPVQDSTALTPPQKPQTIQDEASNRPCT